MKKIKLLTPILLSLILFGCASTGDNEKLTKLEKENTELKKELSKYTDVKKITDKQTSEVKKDNEKTFKNNEEVTLFDKDQKDLASLKITEVSTAQSSFPDHMIHLKDEYDTSKMISVTIEYKNLEMNEGFLPSTHDFQAFDVDGKALERVNQQEGQDRVSKGRASKTKIFFNSPSEGSNYDKIELDYVSGLNKIATFKLDVSH